MEDVDMNKIFKGRGIIPGTFEGEALVTNLGFNAYASFFASIPRIAREAMRHSILTRLVAYWECASFQHPKEVVIGILEIHQGLLQRLAVGFLQPSKPRITFHLRECKRSVVVIHALTALTIVLFSYSQEVIFR